MGIKLRLIEVAHVILLSGQLASLMCPDAAALSQLFPGELKSCFPLSSFLPMLFVTCQD